MAEITILDGCGYPIERRGTYRNPDDWMWETFVGAKSAAGQRVSPTSAMSVVAYFACIRNISEDIASLPKHVMQKVDGRREQRDNHPLQHLIDEPSMEMGAHQFWETITAHALGFHGGFAEIVRNGVGDAMSLELLDPRTVTVTRDRDGRLIYLVRVDNKQVTFQESDIFHIHGLGFDGITGYVMSEVGKEMIGAAMALQKHRGSFFANNAMLSGVITMANTLGDEALERFRRQWQERYSGSENAYKPAILEEGADYKQISTDPERSQMEALTYLSVEEVCRLFRMPPHKIQHLLRAHFNNIGDQRLEYNSDTLGPWVSRFHSEIKRKLLTTPERRGGMYVLFDLRGRMRGNDAERWASYREGYYLGALSSNDIRELEDLDPYKGGDTYFAQKNLQPMQALNKLVELIEGGALLPEGGKEPASDDADQSDVSPAPTQEDQPVMDHLEMFRPVLEDAISRALRAEVDKVKRGIKKDRPMLWARKFYESNDGYLRDALSAQFDGLKLAYGSSREQITKILDRYIALHNAQSFSDVVDHAGFSEWTDGTRATQSADLILAAIKELH